MVLSEACSEKIYLDIYDGLEKIRIHMEWMKFTPLARNLESAISTRKPNFTCYCFINITSLIDEGMRRHEKYFVYL